MVQNVLINTRTSAKWSTESFGKFGCSKKSSRPVKVKKKLCIYIYIYIYTHTHTHIQSLFFV